VRESRYTKEFMDANKKFSLSFLNKSEFNYVKKYCGSVSGRDEDKIENAKLTVNYYEDEVPFIDEADNVIVCKILYKQLMKEENFVSGRLIADNYRNGDYHYIYIAEIKQVMIR
jgi:flavin reductase (DIM6/NTAB) family NADH-FMN oxidoreductase RutF